MFEAVFVRLLDIPVDQKGDVLAEQVNTMNQVVHSDLTFTQDVAALQVIKGSPFAYWAPKSALKLYSQSKSFQSSGFVATKGLATTDDFRFLRLAWEVPVTSTVSWLPFAKGGVFSKYYADLVLVVDWADDGRRMKEYLNLKIGGTSAGNHWSRWINGLDHYGRPGVTWPARTNGFSVRALASGSVFGHKAGVAYVANNNSSSLMVMLAIMNSEAFHFLLQLQLARTELARSYEVGLVQKTPMSQLMEGQQQRSLETLATRAFHIQRSFDIHHETGHIYRGPYLRHATAWSLADTTNDLGAEENRFREELVVTQHKIDEIVFELYGLDEPDRKIMRAETSVPQTDLESADDDEFDDLSDEDENSVNLPLRVQELLQYCVGVAFGRWDIRMALDPTLLPALQGPFDPLPRCAPAALVGADGLPATVDHIAGEPWLRARANVLDLPDPAAIPGAIITDKEYPFPVAWHGILVDDPDHPDDLIGRVQQVLRLLWGERSEAIEQEACAILGVPDLRTWFRDPRQGFFAFHIKRYSRSRRKAPIYWLLQSANRNYGIWLYCHRLRRDALYAAARTPYADAKVILEQGRLEELQRDLDGLAGAERRTRQRAVERQQKVIADVAAFRDRLDKVALLNLIPDLNDGVLISMAPLQPLTPWNEPARMWRELCAGNYAWSTMSQQMAAAGLVHLTR